MAYWDNLERHLCHDEIWLNHPLVRERVNERIAGAREVWPTDWLRSQLRGEPVTIVSLGCGAGSLERDLCRKGIASNVVGIDLSDEAIAEARRCADSEGLSDRITYHVGDAVRFIAGLRDVAGVCFNFSLHHFSDLDGVLGGAARALRSDGFLFYDEYVGPARDEWRMRDLLLPNLIYRTLPAALRRARLVRAPINRDDPSEAVRSSRILPTTMKYFSIQEQRDYGGNLLALLYPNLARPARDDSPQSINRFGKAIAYLLDVEDALLRRRKLFEIASFYSIVLARLRVS